MILEFAKLPRTKKEILLHAALKEIRKNYKPENMSSLEVIRVITPFLMYLQKYGLDVTFNTLKNSYEFLKIIVALLGRLTPREIMTYFPITKTYQGEKWEEKDYYYTLEYLSTIPMDEPVGTSFEDVFNFIWEYQNSKIKALGIALMKSLDKFQTLSGRETFEQYLSRSSNEPQRTKLKVLMGKGDK